MQNDAFKVVVRVRPPLKRELKNNNFVNAVKVDEKGKTITIYDYYYVSNNEQEKVKIEPDKNLCTFHPFTFDYVYDANSTQEAVYTTTVKNAVCSVMEGYNSTVLAYGQTGTGKTYTMEGFSNNFHDEGRGMTPRSVDEIFNYINQSINEKTTFMVRASYLQIYNEVISDLLKPEKKSLSIREDPKKGMYVEGLSEWAVKKATDIYSLIKKGSNSRASASTKMNNLSSRSHAVFIIIVEQLKKLDNGSSYAKIGKLNLVDLAGSEKIKLTGATGKRLEECKNINQSLTFLGNVIKALAEDKNEKYIPYRNSKLTKLLMDSLGGNCKTTMIATLSPAHDFFAESLSTLKFANRAKNIKNKPKINEDLDQKALIYKYQEELKKLKEELNNKNKGIVDDSKILQLEEEKKRAEEDKFNALNLLEEKNKLFFKEREEKKNLEERIKELKKKVVYGGGMGEEYHEQYKKKLEELELERQKLNEDKTQVHQYKNLLIKQRDIMIALTSRLNERDDTILQLQEELDAFEKVHFETEEILNVKNNRISQLEEEIKNNGLKIPKPNKNILRKNTEIIKEKENEKLNNINDIKYDKEENEINYENIKDEYEDKIKKINDESKIEIDDLKKKLKKSDENYHCLLKHMNKSNGNEITKTLQQKFPSVKDKIDNVINSLTNDNDPYKLPKIGKELLTLQKIISKINDFINKNSKATNKNKENDKNDNEKKEIEKKDIEKKDNNSNNKKNSNKNSISNSSKNNINSKNSINNHSIKKKNNKDNSSNKLNF